MDVRVPALLALTVTACAGDRDRALDAPSGVIPARPMTRVARVQAAADADTFFLRVRFDANRGDRDRWLCRIAGTWHEEGGGFRDLHAASEGDAARGDLERTSAMAEVALSVIFDDPSSPDRLREFEQTGCFGLCHENQRHMPNWRPADGPVPMQVWSGFGGFGDVWIWRAHRGGLVGYADDVKLSATGWVGDPGDAAWLANALTTAGLPSFVFDPAVAGGGFAVPWDPTGGSSPFFLQAGSALPASVALASGWTPTDGDCVPASVLRAPGGSRADVATSAVWTGGAWDVTFRRARHTGDSGADVALGSGVRRQLALALHSDHADSRDHYVSFPTALLFSTTGDGIQVVALEGTNALPAFADEITHPVTEVPLVLPGVTSWEYLVGSTIGRTGAERPDDVPHGGDVEVGTIANRCADCHTIRHDERPPPFMDAGPLERLVLRRGGVYGPTPFFGEAP